MMKLTIQRIRLKEAAVMRKRRRWNDYVRKRNIIRYNQPKDKSQKENTQQSPFFGWEVTYVPTKFLISNLEGVLKYINDTYQIGKREDVKRIWMDMRGITEIDIFCICLLLAQINKLATRKVSCYGNYPDNALKRQFIIESGFLKLLKTNIEISSDVDFENQMYMVGKNAVESDRISNSVKKCMKYLIGREEYYPPIYENMIEICANSVEHANHQDLDKNWLVSIFKEADGTMRFILTDTGEGILKTLMKKRSDMFSDFVRGRKDHDVLKRLFLGEYKSRTGEINRHKGLPEIYESYREGFISNLMVLTNGVLYDFKTDENVKLDNEFMGVMITWTLSKQNYETWIKSLSEY